MTCPSTPQLVHVRTVANPRNRCAGCNCRIICPDEASEGAFPVITPACLIMVHARVCASCLSDPALKDACGIRRLALAIVRRLRAWDAAPQSRSDPRARPHQKQVEEPGRHKRQLRVRSSETRIVEEIKP